MKNATHAEIEEIAEERGRDDAGSHYPDNYRDNYRHLRTIGRAIARDDYQLAGRQAKLFAINYASGYRAEVDVFERDLDEELLEAM
jgi:hypothetical protein